MKKAILLLLILLPVEMSGYTINGIQYLIDDEDNVAEVTHVDNGEGTITIPASVQYEGYNYPVTCICDKAFKGTSYTSINLPSTIKK
jgi:hypothetical protein